YTVHNRFGDGLNRFYGKPYFRHRAYFVASAGAVTPETVRHDMDQQTTSGKDSRLDPTPDH
ncbi:MAG: hypothetical protein RBR37_14440, partial [Advenella sp.]|nr:hypothetical protein [Advenella sp.]